MRRKRIFEHLYEQSFRFEKLEEVSAANFESRRVRAHRSTGQNVRWLESLRAVHTHLPIVRCTGADDGNSLVSWTIRECVLDRARDFPASGSITRILKFNVHRHLIVIITKLLLQTTWLTNHLWCKPVKAAQGAGVKPSLERFFTNLVEIGSENVGGV